MINVNINDRTTKVVYESNPLAVNAILLKDERSYSGLERRLQYLMDDKRPLHELIETIRIYNINTPIQYNTIQYNTI